MNKNTPFNRSVLNDIRPHVVANLDMFDLSYKQIDDVVSLVYSSFTNNNYKLIDEDIDSYKSIANYTPIIEKIKFLYKDYLFLLITSFVFDRMNNLPKESFNMILAYDNAPRPTGCNSSTFSNNDENAKSLRKSLELEFAIS